MLRNGQQINAYLGEDRHLYLENSPGKSLCVFGARVWVNERGPNIIVITDIPDKFDGGLVLPPQGWEVQGIVDE